jgi:hypothetical protein
MHLTSWSSYVASMAWSDEGYSGRRLHGSFCSLLLMFDAVKPGSWYVYAVHSTIQHFFLKDAQGYQDIVLGKRVIDDLITVSSSGIYIFIFIFLLNSQKASSETKQIQNAHFTTLNTRIVSVIFLWLIFNNHIPSMPVRLTVIDKLSIIRSNCRYGSSVRQSVFHHSQRMFHNNYTTLSSLLIVRWGLHLRACRSRQVSRLCQRRFCHGSVTSLSRLPVKGYTQNNMLVLWPGQGRTDKNSKTCEPRRITNSARDTWSRRC